MARTTSRVRLSALLVVALALLAVVPASASAATIDFENLDPPGPGGSGLPVIAQYESQGVSFTNASAFDYSEGPSAIPGFAHSGTVAVEPCVAVEFCTSPLSATFTAPQDLVRVWLGYSRQLNFALDFRLTAYNANDQVVGTDDVTLPARPTPTPIQTPLTVDPQTATITKIEVTSTSPDAVPAHIAIDDLEFSAPGPPPPCNAAGPPVIQLAEPQNGVVVQQNAFLFQGSIDARGGSVTSATVSAQSANGTRTASVFPYPIAGPSGGFGPISVNGVLAPGANNLVVTATSCAGSATSAPRQVTWSALPSGAYFEQLGPIEVVQSVQNASNDVPLIAASASGIKRTFARVYLGLAGGGASSAFPVTGRLTATRPDGSRPGGPISIPSLNRIPVQAGLGLNTARVSLTRSLNFELPREWLAAGRLHLEVERLELDGIPTLACVGCENAGSTGPETVRFQPPRPMRIWLVRVPYKPRLLPVTITPRQFDIDMLSSWLRRAYPSSDIRITVTSLPRATRAPADCNEVNAALTQLAAAAQQPPGTRYYGMVSDRGGSSFMRGCALIGGDVGSGPTGEEWPFEENHWDTDGSYADWYGAHEIGHMYGRNHAQACDEDPPVSSYPYAGGLIGNATFDFQGFDAGDAALGIRQQLYDWRAGWTDLMTYCPNEWISNHTYGAILENLCPRIRPVVCIDEILALPKQTAARRGAGAQSRARLSITGSVALRRERVSLDPLSVQPRLALSARPKKSAHAIVLRDADGKVLRRYPFDPKRTSDTARRNASASIAEVVPYDRATERIEITKGKRRLESVAVSEHAPTVEVTAPKANGALEGEVRVRWRSRDADGGRRTYTLLYTDDGRSFSPLATDLKKSSYRVDLSELPGGRKARFKVIVSDGVLADADTSKPLSVAVKAPRVLISTPGPGAEIPAGEPTNLIANATDPQDGPLSGASLVWRSSIQGELGRGPAISASLQPGSHEITLTATNRAGASAQATVTVTVVAEPPVFEPAVTSH